MWRDRAEADRGCSRTARRSSGLARGGSLQCSRLRRSGSPQYSRCGSGESRMRLVVPGKDRRESERGKEDDCELQLSEMLFF